MEEMNVTGIAKETATNVVESVVEKGGLGTISKVGIGFGAAAVIGLIVYEIGKGIKKKNNAKTEKDAGEEDSTEGTIDETK